MQLKLWIDDNNQITFDLRLQSSGDNGSQARPELIAAVITDSQLSDIGQDGILDLASQVVGYFEANDASQRPAADWASEYRDMCR